jgi:hypothetical protein
MKRSFVAVIALLLPSLALAQEFRGGVSGAVTDPSGSAIAGAKVTVTETHTNTKNDIVTNASGEYSALFLLPGDYDIAVEAPGFTQSVRKGLHIGAGERQVIDFKLQVGSASQSVEVTADAPIVNSENASVGQAVTTKEVEDIPLNGRSPIMLAQLAVGVIPSPYNSTLTLVHPFDTNNAFAIGGTVNQTSETLLDGSPNATWDGRTEYSPPQDAVQEVRVKAFDTDASFGHTGGGTINQVMKTGTNQIHGSLYEFNQPSNLTANNFFNNKSGIPNPVTHFNQYGVTAGGPVWIPHVFNGKDKLFWFFAWEGLKDSQPNPTFLSVPTDAEKQGNFSQILTADGTQLYNPYTATQSGSTITRQMYPGNIIPASQINPIAMAYLQFYPEPNVFTGVVKADGYDNYDSNVTSKDNYSTELGRLDYNMSQNSRLSFNIHRTDYLQLKNDYFNNIAEGVNLSRNNWGGNVDEVYTLNPSNIINVRVNFSRLYEAHSEPSAGYDPTQLGFPSYIAANSQRLQIPYITFSTNTATQALSDNGANQIPSQSLQLLGSWTRVMGKHVVKFGGDARQYRLNTITYGNAAGDYSFSGNSWVRQMSSSSSTVVQGQDFASFLLGLPYSGGFDVNTYGSYYSYYSSGFVQDDWRLRSNLTVNLGLRFDHDGPYHEKYGRTENGFDTTDPNPLAAAAQAAYAKNPIAQLPPSAFNVLGGLTFATPGNTQLYNNTSHLVSPRIGLAWSPERMSGKTVVRAGYGIFVAPITVAYLGPNGNYSSTPLAPADQEGFSQSTAMVVTNNNYLTPASTLSNPFPNGFLHPVGSALGLATFAGQAITFMNPEMKSPYSQRWNFGIQHALTSDTLIEVAYIGNHAVHLPIPYTQINGIPRQYLSTLPYRDPNQTYLSGTSVPNPFAGLSTSQNSATTTPAQLLARYPEFPVGDTSTGWTGSGGILEQNASIGSSYFQSLNVHLQKRLSGGLFITSNYIFSKLEERVDWLNDSDPLPEKRISPFNHSQRFVLAFTYELPVGAGKRFDLHSRLANYVLGSWQINNFYTAQLGAPFVWINGSSTTPGDYQYLGGPLNLNNREANTTAFNIGAFDVKSADALQYHIRTFSTAFPNILQDGTDELDTSLLKRFAIKEKSYLQLRVEVFNLLNHATFAQPNTTWSNSAFGTITSTSNRPRSIQIGARLVF